MKSDFFFTGGGDTGRTEEYSLDVSVSHRHLGAPAKVPGQGLTAWEGGHSSLPLGLSRIASRNWSLGR